MRRFFDERHGIARAIGMYPRPGEAALVDGAATLPEHRGHGCQTALLAHRFQTARAEGTRVAVTQTAAGSASQRNLERAGKAGVQADGGGDAVIVRDQLGSLRPQPAAISLQGAQCPRASQQQFPYLRSWPTRGWARQSA